MHFSLISPRPGQERLAAQQWAQDAYREHQWLWTLFPAQAGTPRDFLYRRSDAGGLPRYHVVSERPPLMDVPGWLIQTKPYEPELRVGDVLDFELRANPVVTRRVNDRHSRHDVVMDAKRQLLATHGLRDWSELKANERPALHDLVARTGTSWLQEQGKRHGFDVHADTLAVNGYQQHRVKDGNLRFSTLEFAGALTVAEPTLFSAMLHRGLGHAKAFGCGLMLVRRPL